MHRRVWTSSRVLMAVIACVAWAVSGVPASAAGDPRMGEQWALSVIRAADAWGAGIGTGITIAVVDTGVDFGHEDLQPKLLPGRNFVDPSKSAQDDNGHGTHVAGTAAAATGNGVGVAGAAPGARILPVKVLNANGSGSLDDIREGITWAADNGAHVINLSLGPNAVIATFLGSGLEGAVNDAWSKGSVVVIAAGNDFLFSSSYSTVNAVVVTATTREDRHAGYASGVGSAKWGISAPGGAGTSRKADDILSTHWKKDFPNHYEFLSGTSMATPHVAGAAAVLRGQGLSPQQTVDRLLATAKDLGGPGRDSTFGHGRLDLACAVGRCATPATSTTGATTATSPPPDGGSGAAQSGGTSGSGSSDSGGSGSAPAPTASSSGSGSSGSSASGAGGTAAAAGPSRTTRRPSGSGSRFGTPATGKPAPAATDPAGSVPGDAVPPEQVGIDTPSDSGPAEETPGRPLEGVELARPSAVEERADPALATVAAALLLLISFSALGLRRRRRRLG